MHVILTEFMVEKSVWKDRVYLEKSIPTRIAGIQALNSFYLELVLIKTLDTHLNFNYLTMAMERSLQP